MKNKLKIIYIISFSPKYEWWQSNEEIISSCDHYFTNIKEEIVGVWKGEWALRIGFKLIELFPNISYEVWRPDYHADKIYEHTFENGLIHKSFPAEDFSMWIGMRKRKRIYSPQMEDLVSKIIKSSNGDLPVLIIPTYTNYFSYKFLKLFKGDIPILNSHNLNCSKLLTKQVFSFNPYRLLDNYIRLLQIRKYMRKVDNLIVAHRKYIDTLKNKYSINVQLFSMGVNPDEWKTNDTRESIRDEFGFNDDEKILICSSRIVPEKQIDKLIITLSHFKNENYKLLITGRGTLEYINQLKQLARSHKLEEKIKFVGYVSKKELIKYYLMADLFVTTNPLDAGPASSNLACLFNINILTTNTGAIAEVLEENDCGLLIPVNYSSKWHDAFRYFFNGSKINRLTQRQFLDLKDNKKNMERLYAFIVHIWNDFQIVQSENENTDD